MTSSNPRHSSGVEISNRTMSHKLLSHSVSLAQQANRAVHMFTSQQKAKTRAMLDRIIRFVGSFFDKIGMSLLFRVDHAGEY